MKQFRSLVTGISVSLFVVAAIAVPVSARQGSDDDNEASSSSSIEAEHRSASTSDSSDSISGSNSGSGSSGQKRSGRTVVKTEDARHTAEVENQTEHAAKLRQEGGLFLAKIAKEKKDNLTAEQRQKVCEARKDNLQTKLDRIATRATKQQARYSGVLAKAASYKTTKNISVADWDTLYAAAQAKQATSAASVNALTSAKPTVDCTDTNLVTNLATFKAATKQAKKDLAAYRQSVKLLLAKLEAAQPRTEDQ